MAKFWNMSVDPETRIGMLTLGGDIADASWTGDEVTPRLFKQELDDMGDIDELEIHINSGGGDVFAGQAIYNMIKSVKAHKTVYIDGLAASIASVIAMAGERIVMPANALMMIHEAWTIAAGNKHDLRKQARVLDTIDETIRGVYAARTGLDDDNLTRMMAAETWMTAREAFELGFCTEIEENMSIAASVNGQTAIINGVEIDLNKFRNASSVFLAEADEDAEEPAEDVIEEITENDEHSNGAEAQPVDADKCRKINAMKRMVTYLETH